MPLWKIAGVQMDCKIGDKAHNLDVIRSQLRVAASNGAQLVIFPECILTGYCFDSKEEALPFAETLPGPTTDLLAHDCRELGVHVVVGMLEKAGSDIFNACALVGPGGFVAGYRKSHLPYLGIDRFATPGDRPFAVHDIGGLRVGMLICYDGTLPEPARAMMLLGADVVALPTNWPTGAGNTARLLTPARAIENGMYFAGVNRIGEERGFRFIGLSRIANELGELAGVTDSADATIIYADVDPARARNKHVVRVAGLFELDRISDRRPEMYGPLVAPVTKPSDTPRRTSRQEEKI